MQLKQNLIASMAEINKRYRKLFRSPVNARIEMYVDVLEYLASRNVVCVVGDQTFDTTRYWAALNYALERTTTTTDELAIYKKLDVLASVAPIGPILIECLTTHLANVIARMLYPDASRAVGYLEYIFPVTDTLNGKMRLHRLYDVVSSLDTAPLTTLTPTVTFTDYKEALDVLQKPLLLKNILDSGIAVDLITAIYGKIVDQLVATVWLLDDINDATLRSIRQVYGLDTLKKLNINVARIFNVDTLTYTNWLPLYENAFAQADTDTQRELLAKCIIVNKNMRNAYVNQYNPQGG